MILLQNKNVYSPEGIGIVVSENHQNICNTQGKYRSF